MKAAIFVIAAFLMPNTLSAQVVISEIMYDLEGSDGGKEWIEVFNAGTGSVTLTDWKLFEADTNHKITALGSEVLAPGAYALIVDKEIPAGFSGQVFDSAFSLSNTAETLVLRDADLNDRDTVSFAAEAGAAGDGKSLHRSSTQGTAFVPGIPSPGTGTLTGGSPQESGGYPLSEEDEEEETAPPTDFAVGVNKLIFPVAPQIFAYAGEDQTVIAGAHIELSGRAFKKNGEPIEDARFLWNFGDGSVAEGENVLHHWPYPGRYVVVLDIAQNKYAASHSIIVTAEKAALRIASEEDGSVILTNAAKRTLDLSGWKVRSHQEVFELPLNTLILPGASVALSREITKFKMVVRPVELLYPNGLSAAIEGEEPVVIALSASAAPKTTAPAVKNPPAPRTPAAAPALAGAAEEAEGGLELQAFLQEVSSSARESATASAAPPASSGLSFGWVAGLGALMGLSGAGVIMLRRSGRKAWDIVEDTEKEG